MRAGELRVGRVLSILLLITGSACFAQSQAKSKASVRRPAMRFVATANSVDGITAKGTVAHEGIVAADPTVIPLGSLIQVTGAGAYSGTYAVTDTGPKVAGRHIDIYVPTVAEAKQFGRKKVLVRVLVRGDNEKDHTEVTPAAPTPVAERRWSLLRKRRPTAGLSVTGDGLGSRGGQN